MKFKEEVTLPQIYLLAGLQPEEICCSLKWEYSFTF